MIHEWAGWSNNPTKLRTSPFQVAPAIVTPVQSARRLVKPHERNKCANSWNYSANSANKTICKTLCFTPSNWPITINMWLDIWNWAICVCVYILWHSAIIQKYSVIKEFISISMHSIEPLNMCVGRFRIVWLHGHSRRQNWFYFIANAIMKCASSVEWRQCIGQCRPAENMK